MTTPEQEAHLLKLFPNNSTLRDIGRETMMSERGKPTPRLTSLMNPYGVSGIPVKKVRQMLEEACGLSRDTDAFVGHIVDEVLSNNGVAG